MGEDREKEHGMKMNIAILNYGTLAQIDELQKTLEEVGYPSEYQDANYEQMVCITLDLGGAEEFLKTMAGDERLNWIEFTLQLEA